MENKIKQLAKWLEESNYTIAFTGAGMSTESGIPDFRSKDGLWKQADPMEMASVRSLKTNYDKFHEFYKMRQKNLLGAKPHKGYEILARWEEKGLLESIVTQNVDDFHLAAGNKNVYRIHGTINEFRCSQCSLPIEENYFTDKLPCHNCGGNIRPNVVLFGESLPEQEFQASIEEMKKASLVIVIGTSLTVFPVSQLPDLTKGKKVYINREIPQNNSFDLTFQGSAGELLQKIDKALSL